ncbi:superoxide dismutase [Siccirubricoccus sp. KC 17139]|uniref:Superoxide dismutase n=1 Tax=Siccirubricoccus soli TaxID=2899147 RepID=A0ABT1CYJ3_9PROT|nr:superoxide dismutase [Siccirubricoccus soli]MCO6414733.1 superoxide dismutase [Siccirubricoccus soli]MCP2680863.1 superoxide dismutase [Siccirubricoccus soli]
MHATHARRALLLGAAGAALTLALPRRVFAQAASSAPTGPFTLPPLPYANEANEAAIDARTMQIHHDLHHAAYVNNLNAALREHSQLHTMKLEELLAKIGELPEGIRTAVRNNGGGHANHTMFWGVMGGRGGQPSGELLAAIERDLGGFDQFRTRFEQAANTQFGAGWAFVTVTREGRLAIQQKPNQDTPLMEGGRVLLGNDVWEHAYYLRYQNRRAEYTRAWWNVVNWDAVGQRYAAAKAGTLAI